MKSAAKNTEKIRQIANYNLSIIITYGNIRSNFFGCSSWRWMVIGERMQKLTAPAPLL
jgi:hypothetical protein